MALGSTENGSAATLRIAVVTDIHHGAEAPTNGRPGALDLLREFARFVADARPALVLDLGDRIRDYGLPEDERLTQETAEIFATFAVPVRHICGNHDVVNLSIADSERILGQTLKSETLDLGPWRIALWRANARLDANARFSLGASDLDWLETTIAASDRPLLIASHLPVSGQSLIGNRYFENHPDRAAYPEAAAVRQALRGARQPVVWISGHVHWNSVTFVDGIPHFTQQSLTERFTTAPEPAGALGLLMLDDAIVWQVFGRDPIEVRLPTARAAQRWAPPLS